MAKGKSGSATRSANEIEADLVATRNRLSGTVDELAFRVSPAELKRRQVESLKVKANAAAFDDTGSVRMDRVAGGLGGVAALALSLGTLRRIFHKG